MIWVTAEDVVAIHSRIIQVSGGIDGLRDRAGLEAAIAAPLQSFGGEDLFPTDIEKIARIGFGLASNHAFIDGNKRIVLVSGVHDPVLSGATNRFLSENRKPIDRIS